MLKGIRLKHEKINHVFWSLKSENVVCYLMLGGCYGIAWQLLWYCMQLQGGCYGVPEKKNPTLECCYAEKSNSSLSIKDIV